MSYFHFPSRVKFLHLVIVVVTAFAVNAQAAEWRECEKAKLREMQQQRNANHPKPSKHKKRRSHEDSSQRAEEIDTWLWKNCREFSYELRQLEQEKM